MRIYLSYSIALLALASCGPAAPSRFSSPWGDFEVEMPANWSVEKSEDADAYRFVSWTGPADRRCLWGAPRVVLSWYANGKPFHDALGAVKSFNSKDDYLAQMAAGLWGADVDFFEPRRRVTVAGRDGERVGARMRKPAYMSIPGAPPPSGRPSDFFTRKDLALVVPTKSGFYTATYPASDACYDANEPVFARFLATLAFKKDSPVD